LIFEGRVWRHVPAGGVSDYIVPMPELTAVFQKVPLGYIGFVEELPGANTQGATLEEARANLAEAVQLVLEANRALSEEALAGKHVIREPLRLG
jgi:predicted RNase H-like HicB family nuclease